MTACHRQTNSQIKLYNQTLVERLRLYLSDYQRDWEEYVQPLSYAYNTEVRKSTKTIATILIRLASHRYRRGRCPGQSYHLMPIATYHLAH